MTSTDDQQEPKLYFLGPNTKSPQPALLKARGQDYRLNNCKPSCYYYYYY